MELQKTAMQDLFGIIEKQIGKNFPQEIKEHFIGREKEQIYNAFDAGVQALEDTGVFVRASCMVDEYYSKTYKNN